MLGRVCKAKLGLGLRVIVTLGLTASLLSLSSGAKPAKAAFDGLNGRIAFSMIQTDWSQHIYSMNPDGSGLKQVTFGTYLDSHPVFSPDGTKIVFESNREGDAYQDSDIWVMGSDGTGKSNLTAEGTTNTVIYEDMDPAWSPDGDQIAFASDRGSDNDWDIYVMDTGGLGLTNLTEVPDNGMDREENPAFSPDGTKIAFTGKNRDFGPDRNSDQDVYIMNANGSGLKDLTPDPSSNTDKEIYDSHPAFSPDGTKIAFQSNRSGVNEIYAMNLDGSNTEQLTTSGWNTRPEWSPDGTKIAYQHRPSNDAENIYVMNANGSLRTRLTAETEYGAWDASWQAMSPVIAYAPAVYLHPTEKYFPGSADSFLDHSELLWDMPNLDDPSCYNVILASGADYFYPPPGYRPADLPILSAARMSGSGSSTPYDHYRTYGNADQGCADDPNDTIFSNDPPSTSDQPGASKNKANDSGFVLDLEGTVSKGEDPRTNPLYVGDKELFPLEYDFSRTQTPVYYEYVPGRYIIYWFFYPFNGWKKGTLVEYHGGDWEHIVVRLNAYDGATKVAYYQHYCTPKAGHSLLSWSDVPKLGGTHPKVFSARGGHASFAGTSGELDPPACSNPFNPFDLKNFSPLDEVGKGPLWATWNHTVDATTEPWYGFGGNWGERFEFGVVKNYGPPGPGPIRSKTSDTVPSTWR